MDVSSVRFVLYISKKIGSGAAEVNEMQAFSLLFVCVLTYR